MKNLSIRIKLIGALLLVLALGLGAMLLIIQQGYDADIGTTGRAAAHDAAMMFEATVKADPTLNSSTGLALSADTTLSLMKMQIGNDFGLLLANGRFDAGAWTAAAKQKGAPSALGKAVTLVGTTNRDWADEMTYDGAIDSLPTDGVIKGVFAEGSDHTEIRAVVPVKDGAGNRIGALFVIHDISPMVASLRTSALRVAGAVAMMAVLITGLSYVLLSTLVFRRLDRIAAQMHDISIQIAGGNLDITLPKAKSADEIGRFEKTYLDFLGAVVTTLKAIAGRKSA
jgi:HAMP domain-containing protein